jgi:hypothetical protein
LTPFPVSSRLRAHTLLARNQSREPFNSIKNLSTAGEKGGQGQGVKPDQIRDSKRHQTRLVFSSKCKKVAWLFWLLVQICDGFALSYPVFRTSIPCTPFRQLVMSDFVCFWS